MEVQGSQTSASQVALRGSCPMLVSFFRQAKGSASQIGGIATIHH